MVRNFDQASLLALVRERIVTAFDPMRIVLFGSRARGDARPDSDLDLLVVLQEVSDKRIAAIEIRRALRDLPVGKDVIVTTPHEIQQRGDLIGSILRPALRDGKILYERN
jgi:predicted nucleotidyltransferase